MSSFVGYISVWGAVQAQGVDDCGEGQCTVQRLLRGRNYFIAVKIRTRGFDGTRSDVSQSVGVLTGIATRYPP